MSVQDTLNEFNGWLEGRNTDIQRRLTFAQSQSERSAIKTEEAELQVIQAKFVAMFVMHMPLTSAGATPASLKASALTPPDTAAIIRAV